MRDRVIAVAVAVLVEKVDPVPEGPHVAGDIFGQQVGQDGDEEGEPEREADCIDEIVVEEDGS